MADLKNSTLLPARVKNIIGRTFGRLTVSSYLGPASPTSRNSKWSCACSCGNTFVAYGHHLRSGATKSCGCLEKELRAQVHITHGMTYSREYASWCAAKNRCFNPSAEGFKYYGGRGITMAPCWADSFQQFLKDMGPRPKGTSLNRINNDGNYEPDNAEWSTAIEQARNTRKNATYSNGQETITLSEWAERTGIPYSTLRSRHRKGKLSGRDLPSSN